MDNEQMSSKKSISNQDDLSMNSENNTDEITNVRASKNIFIGFGRTMRPNVNNLQKLQYVFFY